MLKIKKKKLMKRALIVATPIVILSVVFYAAISSHPQAHESTFAQGEYYNDEYANSDDENNSSDNSGDDTLLDVNGNEVEEITSHDSVIIDTNPDSITVLVNKELSLPKEYIPEDLVVPNVIFTTIQFDEKKQMRSEAAKALELLFNAAKQDNLTLYGVSGYRSYDRQYEIFTNNIRKQGLQHTLQYSATPGYSEHQTGLSIDVSSKSVSNRLDDSFAETPEGKWLAQNAHLFGYIIRYPQDKEDITGYSYEPWHIRYVGKALSTYLYKNNLCLEEYYNFKPTKDYSNDITYESLVDYGIDLKDIIPTKVPKPIIKEEETADQTSETVDENSKDENSIEQTGETSDNTKDGQGTGQKDDDTKPKPTPTKAPAPTKTPTPTVAPVPTEAPNTTDSNTVEVTPTVDTVDEQGK